MTEWIQWTGGECPIPDNAEFEVKLRCDHITHCSHCVSFRWHHLNNERDIIAYRLIEKEQSDLDWLEEKVRAEFDYQSDKYQSYVRVATREAFRKVLDLIKQRKEAKP